MFAEDGHGGVCGQYVGITVREPNDPPSATIVGPGPNTVIRVGDSVAVRVSAEDPDGSVSRVDIYNGTELVGTADAEPFVTVWIPETVGETALSAIAYDDDGVAGPCEPLTVNVLEALPDTEPPVVEVSAEPKHAAPGTPVTITITVTDRSEIADIALDINGESVPVNGNTASYTPPVAGFYTATATVTDAAGNPPGAGSVTFGVSAGGDTVRPVARFGDDDVITTIMGTGK